MLELRPSKAEEIPAQKELWKRAFGDDDSYIDNFYAHCAQPEHMLVLLEDGVLRSMLALLPVTIALPDGTSASSSYIYALATDLEARKQGFGRMLLQYVDFFLGQRGVDCVTVVPAGVSLHKFFSTVSFTACFATRKIELLAADVGAAGPEDAILPVSGEAYGALREQLLNGTFHAVYDQRLLAYQGGICAMNGGGLFRIRVGESEGCATVELGQKGSVVVKELLIEDTRIPNALAVISAAFPADHYHLRTPAFWPGHRVSYIQSFAMIKWINGAKRRAWAEENTAYFGLAFD